MNPAYSVIVLTTASGAGYGLMVFIALCGAYNIIPIERWFGFVGFGLGLTLVTTGLLASTFHLGHPERAWRALSQWRSSWLSREGIFAILSYVPAGLMALLWVFIEDLMGFGHILAWLVVILSLATVYSQSMIYGSLRTIPYWNHPLVPFVFVGLSLTTGAILFSCLAALFGYVPLMSLTIMLTLLALIIKLAYWRDIKAMPTQYNAGQATGLGGKITPLDPPHTQPNFVMREMGYKVGRKHKQKLRLLTCFGLFIVPILMLCLALLLPSLMIFCSLIAVVSAIIGVLSERWLFFAEARHVSMLFYGEDAV